MLAADHRWQWEEWCDANGISRERIGEVKALALEGLLVARERSVAARSGSALLIDQQYGATTLARATEAGVTVGTPAERPGVFPLEWTPDPFWNALPGHFAKVLIRYRPEWDAPMSASRSTDESPLRWTCGCALFRRPRAFYQTALERITAEPGTRAATLTRIRSARRPRHVHAVLRRRSHRVSERTSPGDGGQPRRTGVL
jgi:hypothetical protein